MHFYKYHGAGNDFILVDQRKSKKLTRKHTGDIARICERHFGIGADGLILLQEKDGYDFEMIYFNADGHESSLCGNGGRCIAALAHRLGISEKKARFWAIDGAHEAVISEKGEWIELKMADVLRYDRDDGAYVINTGSPHYVRFTSGVEEMDVVREGAGIRFSEHYRHSGINVNFVEDQGEALMIRTYERGVENETLACGTGITAAVLAHHHEKKRTPGSYETPVHAQGGTLRVRYTATENGHYTNIWLCGPAKYVYEGEIDV